MIASTPLGRWCWGEFDAPGGDLERCLRALAAAHAVLVRHGLSAGDQTVHVTVAERGNPRRLLYDGTLRLGAAVGLEGARAPAAAVAAALRPGTAGSASATVHCTGTVAGLRTGDSVVPGLFLLSASAFADFTTVDLETSSDVWMDHDLRGKPQPEVHAANAPRLAGILTGIETALGWETDPDDPTHFATPTRTGLDPRRDADGTVADNWARFELPQRSRVVRPCPP
ncbi:hypothetical protein [Streptomyces clavuligerus]|uniref:hypothetical protein n=1 Tax=Streptomyces clavuligerus TaxID=1901 RepID=UPI0001800802|nr:hypothetical protein [Streptomyces clavuligerus]EDY52949.1 conserved hypothetical protein [Streptomyces clavuligerus]WDN55923.1 hypothetical protein LL058_28925 [Streptomyces clavuligerus]